MRALLLATCLVFTLVSGASAFKMPWSDSKPAAPAAQQGGKAEQYYTEARRAYGSANYSQVIEFATKAIKESPKYAEAFSLRGKASKDMGDVDGAMRDLSHAIELNPHLGEAYYVRAQTNEINGEMKKAETDYKKACAEGVKEACK